MNNKPCIIIVDDDADWILFAMAFKTYRIHNRNHAEDLAPVLNYPEQGISDALPWKLKN